MKHEYHEGPKAGENFEKSARAVFQTPKVENPKRPARKPYASQKDRQRQGLERFLFPRPCLRRVERVSAFSGQLGIDKTLSGNLAHQESEPVGAIQRVIPRRPIEVYATNSETRST